jgi:hypothetical protein
MRRFLFAAGAVAVGLSLVACATPTPYQAAAPGPSVSGYGYSDTKIDDTHWRVTFSGNSLTSRETVEKYLLYRAAELTRQQGFDWFQATDRATDKQTSFYGGDPYYGWGPGWRPYWGFGGPWGWRTWGPWGGPGWPGGFDMQQVDRFEASAEIDMGHGPTPEGRRAFNAAEVIQNLGPSITRPKA